MALAFAAANATSAGAATIDWTYWSSPSPSPTAGSATGAAGGVGVSYSGEVESLVPNYPSWTPVGTFSGGTVGNPPPQLGGVIQLFGDQGNDAGLVTDTITFSAPVTNPVMAIWSLGQNGIDAQFNFNQPFTIESGGPSAEYAGNPITASGETVFGIEGNGTIQFNGTFSQISWTNPVYEDWYGFTVGAPVPEPATWAMMLVGFAGLGAAMRSRRKQALAVA